MGPPIDPPNWFRFVFGTNLPVSGSGSDCENGLRDWNRSFWKNSNPLPRIAFVPDFVCTETTPAVA